MLEFDRYRVCAQWYGGHLLWSDERNTMVTAKSRFVFSTLDRDEVTTAAMYKLPYALRDSLPLIDYSAGERTGGGVPRFGAPD